MYDFAYRKASSAADAASRLAAASDGKFLAGGMTLLPALKQRLADPSDLVDLADLTDLAGIADDGDSLTVGAMTTHGAVATDAAVRRRIPALADLAGQIGDPQVRNRGTIGGSIANNDPAADYPAACLALDAGIVTNSRRLQAGDFFTGLFETALADNELVTAVRFPVPERAAYKKFPNPASRYALVGVFVAMTGGGARVAVTGAGMNGVFRVTAMEAALDDNWSPDAIAGIAVSPDDLVADIHAASDYRAHLIGVMAKRAVAAAA